MNPGSKVTVVKFPANLESLSAALGRSPQLCIDWVSFDVASGTAKTIFFDLLNSTALCNCVRALFPSISTECCLYKGGLRMVSMDFVMWFQEFLVGGGGGGGEIIG